MAITFVNASAEANGASGDLTLTAPSSPQVDDIWIAAVHARDTNPMLLGGSWNTLIQGASGTNGLAVFWHRYAGVTPNLVVDHTGAGDMLGGIAAFRGVQTFGVPTNKIGSIATGADSSIEHTGVSPTANECMIVAINGGEADTGRTPPGGYTARFEDSAGGTQNAFLFNSGLGNSLALHTLLQTDAVPTGTVVDTAGAGLNWVSALIALGPAVPPMSAEAGAYNLTGTAALLTFPMPADAGVYNLTGFSTQLQAPGLVAPPPMAAESGAYHLVGGNMVFRPRRIKKPVRWLAHRMGGFAWPRPTGGRVRWPR